MHEPERMTSGVREVGVPSIGDSLHHHERRTEGAHGANDEVDLHQQPDEVYAPPPNSSVVSELADALAANVLLQQEVSGLRLQVQELERRNAGEAVEVARINRASLQQANSAHIQMLMTTIREREARIDQLEQRLAQVTAAIWAATGGD